MSKVIEFLESAGSSASFAKLSSVGYMRAVAQLGAGTEEENALMSRDAAELVRQLGGRSRMICMVVTPEEDPDVVEPDFVVGSELLAN